MGPISSLCRSKGEVIFNTSQTSLFSGSECVVCGQAESYSTPKCHSEIWLVCFCHMSACMYVVLVGVAVGLVYTQFCYTKRIASNWCYSSLLDAHWEIPFPWPHLSPDAMPHDDTLSTQSAREAGNVHITRAGVRLVAFSPLSLAVQFSDQYLEISTVLPKNPNLYGLGEHIKDSFRLPLWVDEGTVQLPILKFRCDQWIWYISRLQPCISLQWNCSLLELRVGLMSR